MIKDNFLFFFGKYFKKEQPKQQIKVVKITKQKYKTNIQLMQQLANKKQVDKKITNKLKKDSKLKEEMVKLLGVDK